MSNFKLVGLLVCSLLSASASADTAPQVLEGRVVNVVNAGSFVMDGEQRAVVYHRAVSTTVSVGDRVRVVGKPIDDWMRMDGIEINADKVEPISP